MDPTNLKDGAVDFEGVEIAEFPCVDDKGKRWGPETADDLVANFCEHGNAALKPPLVLVHEETDPKTGAALPVVKSGLPALGWVTGLRKVGAKLVADLRRVPEKVAALVQRGAYRRVSASWWNDGGKAGFPGAEGKPVLRHVALLGADVPLVKTLKDVLDLFGVQDAATAAFAEPDDAEVASFAEVASQANVAAPAANGAGVIDARGEEVAAGDKGAVAQPPPAGATAEGGGATPAANLAEAAPAAAPPPETLREAIREEPAETPLRRVLRAINARTWGIGDEGGTEPEIVAALSGLAAEIQQFLAAYRTPASAPDPVQVAAASMSEPTPGGPHGTPPSAGATSETSQAAVATFVVRLTAAGRLLPKHAPALKAQAAACFAHGGDEAVASFLDDEDARRKEKVLDLGEQGRAGDPASPGSAGAGAANFAELLAAGVDAAAIEAATAEFPEVQKRFPAVTLAAYVKARTSKK